MSFKIIGAAFDLPLIGNDKLVFLSLCENADDTTRTCYPSYSTIQRKASLANSSLKTCLLVLEAVGLIVVKIRSTKKGGRTSTIYTINEFETETFDVENYKKIAKEIRTKRNFREKKDTQSPKFDIVENRSNLRNSIEIERDPQPPKFDTDFGLQPPKFGEEPLASSFKPLALREENTPQPPKRGVNVGTKLKTPALSQIADQHRITISTIEDFLEFRVNSGGIETPIAFEKYVLREVADPYSDESAKLEEWFEALRHTDIIDHLVGQFLSTQRTDRRFCRELAKDDLILKAHNIDPSDVVIEIAYQKAETKRREKIGGAA